MSSRPPPPRYFHPPRSPSEPQPSDETMNHQGPSAATERRKNRRKEHNAHVATATKKLQDRTDAAERKCKEQEAEIERLIRLSEQREKQAGENRETLSSSAEYEVNPSPESNHGSHRDEEYPRAPTIDQPPRSSRSIFWRGSEYVANEEVPKNREGPPQGFGRGSRGVFLGPRVNPSMPSSSHLPHPSPDSPISPISQETYHPPSSHQPHPQQSTFTEPPTPDSAPRGSSQGSLGSEFRREKERCTTTPNSPDDDHNSDFSSSNGPPRRVIRLGSAPPFDSHRARHPHMTVPHTNPNDTCYETCPGLVGEDCFKSLYTDAILKTAKRVQQLEKDGKYMMTVLGEHGRTTWEMIIVLGNDQSQ